MGFYAQIGDPSGKLSARQSLTVAQVEKNLSGYKKLIGKILDVKKANIRFLNNEAWTNKLKPKDLLEIASQLLLHSFLNVICSKTVSSKEGRSIFTSFYIPCFKRIRSHNGR